MTETAAAPRTYALTDEQFAGHLGRMRAAAAQTLDQLREQVGDGYDFAYAMEYKAEATVEAQAKFEFLTRALNAPADKRRAHLADQVGRAVSDTSRGDAWFNAVKEAKRKAALNLVSMLGSELDADALLAAMS